MSRLIHLPDDVALHAERLVAAGRFASVEDAVRAGVEAIAALADDELAADEAAWADHLARSPSDPRDLTAREARACANSADPAKQRALDAHLDALCQDLDRGKGIESSPAELMARVRARLGVPAR